MPTATDHIVALLVAERDKLNRAIEAIKGPVIRRGKSERLQRAISGRAGLEVPPSRADGKPIP